MDFADAVLVGFSVAAVVGFVKVVEVVVMLNT